MRKMEVNSEEVKDFLRDNGLGETGNADSASLDTKSHASGAMFAEVIPESRVDMGNNWDDLYTDDDWNDSYTDDGWDDFS